MTEECPWSSVDVKVAGDGGGTAASNPEYTWSQTADEVTFEMPVLSARKSSLTATTDGHKLKVTSDRGRLVVELYASVIVLDRAKMRRGTLILTMRKMHAETWPSFERDVQAQSAHQEIDGGGDDGATRASPVICMTANGHVAGHSSVSRLTVTSRAHTTRLPFACQSPGSRMRRHARMSKPRA